MKELFEQKIKELEKLGESDFPPLLHKRIMNKVTLLRFRPFFFVALIVLILNFSVFSFFSVRHLIWNDIGAFVGFMVREFELTPEYLFQFLSVVYENTPLGLIFAALLNLLISVYLWRLYLNFKYALSNPLVEKKLS